MQSRCWPQFPAVWLLAGLGLVAASSSSATATDSRPNILLIVIEHPTGVLTSIDIDVT